MFAFPCIWRRYQGPIKEDGPKIDIKVFVFLTTTPNKLVATINYQRMPVLLMREEEFDVWLNDAPTLLSHWLRSTPAGTLRSQLEVMRMTLLSHSMTW